ncbi:unnamed protein product [Symbiodinium pilosum]|uniref:Flavoprotein pyridine nucleotide cytochrome reductase-like FAD-binding domain-containing protein n=1 Tax=Symbiodinium pilosum TaxID=2952 RepID=A0A812KA95_SYMPI|nr:unnamed protein product [Symbiodinium pilosum]
MVQRLANARQLRIRQQAREENKWNVALSGMGEQVVKASGNQRLRLQMEHADLLYNAGFWEEALEQITAVQKAVPDNLDVILAVAKILSKVGRVEEIMGLESLVRRICCDPEDFRLECELLSRLGRYKSEADAAPPDVGTERRIENYAIWRLDSVTLVSKHSAVYHFTSKDRIRGTPNPRGRGRSIWPKTWHITLLAKVGANAEGPLGWIERDYTPISTCHEWEQGKCDILIKIYGDGQATSWLREQPLGSRIWLSQPMRTLGVPSLVPNLDETTFRPASYLLLLAGTGIVVAAQVLHHAEPGKCFGSFPVLTSPIRLVQSCRSDDVLMISELAESCTKGRLQSWALFVTEARAGMTPFPEAKETDLSSLAQCSNVTLHDSRLSRDFIGKELQMCQKPCRVVVSGPASFNAACKTMLQELACDLNAVTILSA